MSADADIVMMSKASAPELTHMTQHAINTARYGALPLTLDVYVMEQVDVAYRNAVTSYMPGEFNYNAFANKGAKMGNSPWIVFCNNDLIFEDRWLQNLLALNQPVVSPRSPGYHRHRDLRRDERGDTVGRHLAGWCFMMARQLWEDLGGLDETYPFWCADNAVMDQLRAKGIQATVARDAIVHHTVSATLLRCDRQQQDDLTWAALHQYNQDTGSNHLHADFRYTHWKNRNGI